MKNLILIAFTLFALNAVAQEKQTIAKHDKASSLAKIEARKLTKQLDLTTEQEDQVYKVMLIHFKEELQRKQKIKQMVISNDKTKKAEAKKAIAKQKQGYSEKLNAQLEEILTPEQYKTYEETSLAEEKTKQKVLKKKY